MEILQIFEKYLPMLQELQMKVAMHGDKRVTMEVKTEAKYLLGDISIIIDNKLEQWCRCYFFDGETEDSLDQKIVDLNAFFAGQCITIPRINRVTVVK